MSWTPRWRERQRCQQITPAGELAPTVGQDAGKIWQTQTYCEGLLGTPGKVFRQKELQVLPPDKFDHVQGEEGDIESKWTMFQAPIVEVVEWCCSCRCLLWQYRTGRPGGLQLRQSLRQSPECGKGMVRSWRSIFRWPPSGVWVWESSALSTLRRPPESHQRAFWCGNRTWEGSATRLFDLGGGPSFSERGPEIVFQL